MGAQVFVEFHIHGNDILAALFKTTRKSAVRPCHVPTHVSKHAYDTDSFILIHTKKQRKFCHACSSRLVSIACSDMQHMTRTSYSASSWCPIFASRILPCTKVCMLWRMGHIIYKLLFHFVFLRNWLVRCDSWTCKTDSRDSLMSRHAPVPFLGEDARLQHLLWVLAAECLPNLELDSIILIGGTGKCRSIMNPFSSNAWDILVEHGKPSVQRLIAPFTTMFH
jgi:hypothetical protein